jgi:hypothetical protein
MFLLSSPRLLSLKKEARPARGSRWLATAKADTQTRRASKARL